jgi:hypothetical protein
MLFVIEIFAINLENEQTLISVSKKPANYSALGGERKRICPFQVNILYTFPPSS